MTANDAYFIYSGIVFQAGYPPIQRDRFLPLFHGLLETKPHTYFEGQDWLKFFLRFTRNEAPPVGEQ